jgi:c-di-AMP phosphodiesterase-like protein
MKVQIPPNIANYLLAGIYLDTNKMQKNVTQSTLETASKLLGQGADLNHVMDYFQEDFDSDRRVQDLINKNRMIVYKIGMIVADPDEEYTTKELARAADYALTFGPDASFAIGKISDDTIAVSARSKEKVDIGKLMNVISNGKGGGTPFSAAATINKEDTKEIGKRLEKLLRPQFYLESE